MSARPVMCVSMAATALYQRAVENGITFVICRRPAYTFQDNKTNGFDGADVCIFREITKRLGITKVTGISCPSTR